MKQLSLTAMFAKAFTPSQGMKMQTYYDKPVSNTEASLGIRGCDGYLRYLEATHSAQRKNKNYVWL